MPGEVAPHGLVGVDVEDLRLSNSRNATQRVLGLAFPLAGGQRVSTIELEVSIGR